MDASFTMQELVEKTESLRERFNNPPLPDTGNEKIPESVLKYKPVMWKEDELWNTVLGSLPDEGIWVLGTTPVESMQEFDKELKARLDTKTDTIRPIHQEEFKELHKEVFIKVDKVIEELENKKS